MSGTDEPGAGELRERVSFRQPTQVGDGRGGRATTYPEAFPRPARLQPVDGREAIDAQRIVSGVTWILTCRRDSETVTVTTAWRVTWDDRTFTIATIRPSAKRRTHLVMDLKETTS